MTFYLRYNPTFNFDEFPKKLSDIIHQGGIQ